MADRKEQLYKIGAVSRLTGINPVTIRMWETRYGAVKPVRTDGKQRMGGYVTRYENNFDFLTIRGSGHMVPEFKPAQTLVSPSCVCSVRRMMSVV